MLDHRKGLQILPQRGNHDFGACLIFSFDHTHLERKLWYYCDIIMLPEWETRAETLKHSETFSSHLVGPDNFLVAWPCSCSACTLLFFLSAWHILWFGRYEIIDALKCSFDLVIFFSLTAPPSSLQLDSLLNSTTIFPAVAIAIYRLFR